MEKKICNACNIEKNLSEFHKNRKSVLNKCKNCRSKENIEKYANTIGKERILEVNKKTTNICKKCLLEKNVEEFLFDKTRHILYNVCKDCKATPVEWYRNNKKRKAEKGKIWLKKNKKKFREYQRLRTNKIHQEFGKFLEEYKTSHSCVDCKKFFKNSEALDFDHVVGEKTMLIPNMYNMSEKRIKEEIEKCDLRCVLCHRKKTYLEQKGKRKLWPCEERNTAIIREAKNKPCEICNIKYEFYQMDLDHLGVIKKTNRVSALYRTTEKKLREEINKCRVLCAMCHRIHSRNQRNQNFVKAKRAKRTDRSEASKYGKYYIKIQWNSREIAQLTIDNKFIKRWKNNKEVIENIKVNVSCCLSGRFKTAGGFKWMYYEDYLKQQSEQDLPTN